MVTLALLFRPSTTPLETRLLQQRCPAFARHAARVHFDALLVGNEAGVLVDKTSETMAAV
jgi:hypothetical protein